MKLTFRDATSGDAPVIAALHNAAAGALTARFGEGHWSSLLRERSALLAQRHSRVRVGRSGKRILTVLRLATRKPWAIDVSYFTPVKRPLYLTGMTVSVAHHGQGLGRLAIEDARAVATAWPADAWMRTTATPARARSTRRAVSASVGASYTRTIRSCTTSCYRSNMQSQLSGASRGARSRAMTHPMVFIPERLAAVCRQTAERATWLEHLPDVVRELQDRWRLSLERPVESEEVSSAWVARAVRRDGTRAVLKLGSCRPPWS